MPSLPNSLGLATSSPLFLRFLRLYPSTPICHSLIIRQLHSSSSRCNIPGKPILQHGLAVPHHLLNPHSYNRSSSFSTSPRSLAWFKWWRGLTTPRKRQLPPLASFLDAAASSSGRAIKAANEPRLRCTEFNENGNVTLVNGEFKKSELIAKYGLLPRDLRKIDSSLLPHILVRPSAILINLLHLRVLIKHNRVLVFDAYGSTDSYTQSVFMYDLEGKLRQLDARTNGSLPYEFRALEAVLISVTSALEHEFEGVREPVVRVLRELEDNIDRDKLRYLLIYSKKLGTFEQTARLVRDALEELLEADDDLAAMYLSAKADGKEHRETEHNEVELLLESYHKVTNEIVQAAENLVSSIRNTEEIVKAILDANRNSLMLLDLRFSVYTLAIGAGTFVAALYGMNLKNFIEESFVGFGGISLACAIMSLLVVVFGLRLLRRVQRVSIRGSSSNSGNLISPPSPPPPPPPSPPSYHVPPPLSPLLPSPVPVPTLIGDAAAGSNNAASSPSSSSSPSPLSSSQSSSPSSLTLQTAYNSAQHHQQQQCSNGVWWRTGRVADWYLSQQHLRQQPSTPTSPSSSLPASPSSPSPETANEQQPKSQQREWLETAELEYRNTLQGENSTPPKPQ